MAEHPAPVAAADRVLTLARERGPRCGASTVVLVDGPAGSGKTTLASAIAARAGEEGWGCVVVHMDDLYAGWTGLREGGAAVTALLRQVAAGGPARYRRYDWEADAYAEAVPVPVEGLLVVEGVGSTRTAHLALASALVWVEEPARAERMRRGLARDGVEAQPHWQRWMQDEATLFAEVGTRAAADLRVDGVGRLVADLPVTP